MRRREILVGTLLGRASAALVVDGRLDDLLVDLPAADTTPRPGEIRWAKVDRLVPKLGGAFLRLGAMANGYLRETKGIREGAGLMVQVTGHPEAGKAVPVTTRLLYKGRLVIHTPDAPGVNVSRQIRDEAERARLTAAVGQAAGDAGGGFIVRSAAEGAAEDEIAGEAAAMLAARRKAEEAARAAPPLDQPLGPAQDAHSLALREWTAEIPDRIVISAPDDIVRDLPASLRHVVEAAGGEDPFERAGLRDALAALATPMVPLPSGGSMLVEPTMAVVAIDVNTGGDFSPAAGMKANLEAARELVRQLRLRGLGGQVVVDFAPMRKTDRRRLEDALKASLRRDPIETVAHGWTTLGLFELQRKRERRPLGEFLARIA